MDMKISPLENIGIEVLGLEPCQFSDLQKRSDLYSLWLEHGVILFRGLGTNSDVHRDLTRCFGPLEEQEEVVPSIRSKEKGLVDVSRDGIPAIPSYHLDGKIVSGAVFWHQDTIFTPEICRGGVLRMIVPSEIDGETAWIDTAKVYDSLSSRMRARIDKLEVRHRFRPDLDGIPFGLDPLRRQASQKEAPYEKLPMPVHPDVIHPLVSTHPETGRKSLSISPQTLVHIMGMDPAESHDLLSGLVEHTLRDDFKWVHRWGKDDLVLWDNRRTIHGVLGYPPGQRRVAQRTTLAGGIVSGRFYHDAVVTESAS